MKPIPIQSSPKTPRLLCAFFLAALALAACEKKPPPEIVGDHLILSPASFDDLPGWRDDRLSETLPAFERSCARLDDQPETRAVGPGGGGLAGTVADWKPVCAALGALPAGDDDAARAAFETLFAPFKALNNNHETGLFTGYYEAELKGAMFPGEDYGAPIYALPPDLVTVDLKHFRADLAGERLVGRVEEGRLVPYLTRKEIDNGAFDGKNLELLWSNDPVDVFFLQVQGSGRVRMPDGSERRIGYAGNNGYDFFGIGRALIKEGKVPRDQASMQGIRAWLRAHPEEGKEVMQRNERFIFFRWIEGEGPIGAQGVALTPGRSLAVDPAFLPLGVPLFLDTTWPGNEGRPLRRLLVAQDVGGAIKGPLRGDFFWGSGEPALEQAGRMKQKGRLFLLLPKSVAERRKTSS